MTDAEHACTCGETFDSEAALSGHLASCSGSEVTPDDETPDDDSHRVDDVRLRHAVNEIDGLYVRMTGQVWATVLSVRNDGVSAYRVNIEKLECYAANGQECPDYEFNNSQEPDPAGDYLGSEVCDHIAAAIYAAPEQVEMETMAVDAAVDVLAMLQEAADSAHDTAKVMERAKTTQSAAATERAAQGSATPEQTARSDDETDQTGDAPAKAEKLQEALDEVVDGFDVQHHKGKVWLNKTPDAPDELPGPGSTDAFEAFLSNPAEVNYVHDDHDLAGETPGEYWVNFIEPDDVDHYIRDVLGVDP